MAIADIIAGVTLGLTMIPQSIAYASLAGLLPQYGLYAAFVGSLIYVVFGSIKEVSIGPTSLMSLLTLQYTINKPVEFVIILSFLAGIVEFLMGCLRLGFIVDFISIPVTSAFTSGTSLIIIGSQLKSLLGIKYSSKGFVDSIYELLKRLGDTKLWDTFLGIGCILFLLLLRLLKDIPTSSKENWGKVLKKGLWYLSISRNALVVLISASIAYALISDSAEIPPFKLSGRVEPGLPRFMLPQFTIVHGNTTYEFLDICAELSTGIIVVPLVAVLANVAIAKSFTTGTVVDATQEMITLGLCNIIGSCVKSMPTCGAFTRSAVSQASGVKTPMAGLYSGFMTILALTLLTPYFYYIPSTTLSAVLICAVLFMIDFQLPLHLWRQNRRDLVAWIGSFSACIIFGVEIGLLCGILINMFHLLYMWARPLTSITIQEDHNNQYIKVVPNFGMYYLGVDYLREKVNEATAATDYKIPIVIDCSRFSGLDYTSTKGIESLANDLNKNKLVLVIVNLESNLQKLINISDKVLFCDKQDTLIEILTQENIRKTTSATPLMRQIRDSDEEISDKLNVIMIEKNIFKRICPKNWTKLIQQRIHILSWITTYNKEIAIADFISGVSLGLTLIPQSIALAALLGLPSQYGLYASFIGSLIYVIFGSIKEVSIGPTNLMAILTLQYTMNKPVEFIIILAFLAGIVEFLMGCLKLGFIVDFISMPVTSAFTSATSLIILGSQLQSLLGITYSSNGLVDSIYELAKRLRETKKWDSILGIGCIIFILLLGLVKDIPISSKGKWGKALKKGFWYFSISRNALVVVLSSLLAYFLITDSTHIAPFTLSSRVEPGLPNFMLPPFKIIHGNTTYEFLDICAELGTGILVVPLVAVLVNVAIAKSFSAGTVVDATQEMITLGLCNIIGSCVQSMPTCGALTRSAISQASGVKTPMAGLYSGLMTILSLTLLTPYFNYIPSATLAAVLICAVLFMVDLRLPFQLWRQSKCDSIAWFGCFIFCIIFGVEIGLLCGILINIIYLLYMWARPQTTVNIQEIENCKYIKILPNNGMFYPGVDHLREIFIKAIAESNYILPVVIDCCRIIGLDYTSAKGFESLANDLKKHKLILILQNLEPKLQTFLDLTNNIYFCTEDNQLKNIILQRYEDVTSL